MNKLEIKDIIREEKLLYIPTNYYFNCLIHQKRYTIWKYLKAFRLAQSYKYELNDKSASRIKKAYASLMYRIYQRKKNTLGEKCGVEIANHSTLGRRLDIWHGGVIISGTLGDDCVLHGNNVIGNKGNGDDEIPILGNGVDLGVGAVVIGGIHIADNCKIGANAVVMKDFKEAGSLIVGIPAQVKGK